MKKTPKKLNLRLPKQALARLPRPALTGRFKRGKAAESDTKLLEAIQNLPRITNETVAEHREEVLSSARKYIYPLSHSKRRIVGITGSLLALAVVLFFSYCIVSLYKLRSTSTFMYGVTQVIPFPVAKVGGSWVSYESYLFELRHSVHYYQTQQQEDFSSKAGKLHLAKLEQDSMTQVISDALVKQLAAKNHVTVSASDVSNQVALLRTQNRLGSSDEVFKTVLSEYWGWTIDDFDRELKQQLLAQKVVAKLDTGTQMKAQNTLNQLNTGANFGTLASQVSDDTSTKANGGKYGIPITPNNRDLPVQVIQALFKLKVGQPSGLINTGYALEIDEVLSGNSTSVEAAHIVFNFTPVSTYTNAQKAKEHQHVYIKLD